jgi:hypothetical protein
MTNGSGTQTNQPEFGGETPFDFWSKCFEHSAEQMKMLLDCATDTCDPVALRRRWLDDLSKNLDAYMRSPVFLEAMQRNFEAVTQFKSLGEDWARDTSRATGIPRITDISGLFERLQIGQELILSRLSAIEQRLEALEKKRKNHTS